MAFDPMSMVRRDSAPTECPRCHEDVLIIQGLYARFAPPGPLLDVRLWCPLCDGLEGSKP